MKTFKNKSKTTKLAMSFPQIALTTLTLAVATTAFAYETGDIIVRVGAAYVNPNDDSSYLRLNGTLLQNAGLPASQASVEDETQLGLTATYMINQTFGVELLAATPFTHQINIDGLNLQGGETQHLPPTLSLQYYPLGGSSGIQPYAGIGLNYTFFFDEEVDVELNNALRGLGATGDSSLSLDDSLGLAAQLGIDIALNDRWLINAAVWYLDIDTEATVSAPGLGDITTKVDIDPMTYMLSVGYHF